MNTKKAFAFVGTLALGAMVVSSCIVGDDDRSNTKSNSRPVVRFTADIKKTVPIKTRVVNEGDNWAEGDAVGIFMLAAGVEFPTGVIPDTANKRYNVADAVSGELQPDESTSPIIEYPTTGAAVDFVAYYPYVADAENKIDEYGTYKVSLANQRDPAAIDVMTAEINNASKGPVKFVFNHRLSKITINVRLAGDEDAPYNNQAAIEKAELSSTPASARIDLRTGSVTDGPNGKIALKKNTPAKGYAATFAGIVAPSKGGGRYVTITFGGRPVVWDIPAVNEFKAGQNNVYWGVLSESGFRVEKSEIESWTPSDKGEISATVPAKIQQNYRITWKNGRYALTNEPTDGGLFFKFGSVVGVYTDAGVIANHSAPLVSRYDGYHEVDLVWDPTGKVAGEGKTGWETIPSYTKDDHPNTITPSNPDVVTGYHTVENIKAGKGDPCRLVGLDLDKIKKTDASKLSTDDIDNKKWRLPTPFEQRIFSGRDVDGAYTEHWTTLKGVAGGMFPQKNTGDEKTFLPALGYRGNYNGAITSLGIGFYWSSSASENAGMGRYLYFHNGSVTPADQYYYACAFSVRCVLQ
jgi:hypothetical protein